MTAPGEPIAAHRRRAALTAAGASAAVGAVLGLALMTILVYSDTSVDGVAGELAVGAVGGALAWTCLTLPMIVASIVGAERSGSATRLRGALTGAALGGLLPLVVGIAGSALSLAVLLPVVLQVLLTGWLVSRAYRARP